MELILRGFEVKYGDGMAWGNDVHGMAWGNDVYGMAWGNDCGGV